MNSLLSSHINRVDPQLNNNNKLTSQCFIRLTQRDAKQKVTVRKDYTPGERHGKQDEQQLALFFIFSSLFVRNSLGPL